VNDAATGHHPGPAGPPAGPAPDPEREHPPPGPVGSVGVVVAAAGLGLRLGGQGPKALVRLAGRPLLAWTLADLEASVCAGPVVVAAHPDALAEVRALVQGADTGGRPFGKVHAVVAGGATRQQSVAAGLAALPAGVRYVAVHDAARPLTGPALLDRLLALLHGDPDGAAGVVPGAPVTDTIREVDAAGRSKGVVDRERLLGMQTPQVFVRTVLVRAHALAARDHVEATDEAALVERAGGVVRVTRGPAENLKVTTRLDLTVAEAILARRGRP
jgi:2-C-methyl-D-erythritol 4-phosphate cytidylyltransferase